MKYKDGTAYSDWYVLQEFALDVKNNKIELKATQHRKRPDYDPTKQHYPLWVDHEYYVFTCGVVWTYSDKLWRFCEDNLGKDVRIRLGDSYKYVSYVTLRSKDGVLVRLRRRRVI